MRRGHLNGAGSRHAPEIVADQIRNHQVLGPIAGIVWRVRGEAVRLLRA